MKIFLVVVSVVIFWS